MLKHFIMKYNLLLFAIVLISVACKKKAEIIEPDRINTFTNSSSKIWILNNITSNGKSIIDECAKDDEYEFVKASLTINYEPISKCYVNDDSKILSYQISTDQKSILIDSILYKIDELSSTKMVLSHDGLDGAKISVNQSILHAQQTLTLIAK